MKKTTVGMDPLSMMKKQSMENAAQAQASMGNTDAGVQRPATQQAAPTSYMQNDGS